MYTTLATNGYFNYLGDGPLTYKGVALTMPCQYKYVWIMH
jgi:hypothetical protein